MNARMLAVLVIAIVAAVLVPIILTKSAPGKAKSILVVPTGADLQVSQTSVSSGEYTMQIHSLAYDPVLVTIAEGGHRLVHVTVPANGWKFAQLALRSGASYGITASEGSTIWRTSVSVS